MLATLLEVWNMIPAGTGPTIGAAVGGFVASARGLKKLERALLTHRERIELLEDASNTRDAAEGVIPSLLDRARRRKEAAAGR